MRNRQLSISSRPRRATRGDWVISEGHDGNEIGRFVRGPECAGIRRCAGKPVGVTPEKDKPAGGEGGAHSGIGAVGIEPRTAAL
jgi:hypothetical protein